MSRVIYETDLESIHLDEDSLSELFTLLQTDSVTEVTIKLHANKFTYEYDTVDEIIEDSTLPGFIQSFELVVVADDNRLKLTSDDDENQIKLRISGEQEWAREQRRTVEEFFEKRGDRVRTLAQKWLVWAVAGLLTGGVLLLDRLGFSMLFRLTDNNIVVVAFGSLLVAGVVKSAVDYLHPYALIRLTNRRLHPYVSKAFRWLTIVAGLLTIVFTGSQVL